MPKNPYSDPTTNDERMRRQAGSPIRLTRGLGIYQPQKTIMPQQTTGPQVRPPTNQLIHPPTGAVGSQGNWNGPRPADEGSYLAGGGWVGNHQAVQNPKSAMQTQLGSPVTNTPMTSARVDMNRLQPNINATPQMTPYSMSNPLADALRNARVNSSRTIQAHNSNTTPAPMGSSTPNQSGGTPNQSGGTGTSSSGLSGGTSTSTSSNGLSAAGSTNTNDTVNNGYSGDELSLSFRANILEHNGYAIDPNTGEITKDGATQGNINDPSSWAEDVMRIIDQNQGADATSNLGGTYGDLNQKSGNLPATAPTFSPGEAPQIDESALRKQEELKRAENAKQQARAIRAQMELGSGDADASAAGIGDVQSQFALGTEQQINTQRLEAQKENFSAKMVWYQSEIQRALAAQQFDYAKQLQAKAAQTQADLVRLQNELQNQITGKDILGGFFNAAGAGLGIYGALK